MLRLLSTCWNQKCCHYFFREKSQKGCYLKNSAYDVKTPERNNVRTIKYQVPGRWYNGNTISTNRYLSLLHIVSYIMMSFFSLERVGMQLIMITVPLPCLRSVVTITVATIKQWLAEKAYYVAFRFTYNNVYKPYGFYYSSVLKYLQ